MKEILHCWYTELTTAIRDKGILIFILFVPLAYPLLYSYVYTNEVVREVPFVVVDEADTPLSRRFVRMMDATPDARLVARCRHVAEAEEHIRRQEAYGLLRIPRDFDRELQKGEQTRVGIYCDMSSMLYYKALLLAANNVSLEMNRDIKVSRHLTSATDRQEEIDRMPVEYDYVPLYNPQSGFAAFLIPPVLMLIIQQTLLLGIGMAMGTSTDHYPVNSLTAIIGKTLFYFPLYLLLGIYMFTFVTRSFGLPQLGDYLTFLAFLTPYLLSCICLAVTLSYFVRGREESILLFVFLSVPMLFLSGISWPGSSMPRFWKAVSYLFPSTFGMNGYVRITGMGASLADVSFEWWGLWMQTLLYFLSACLSYNKRMIGKCHFFAIFAGKTSQPE